MTIVFLLLGCGEEADTTKEPEQTALDTSLPQAAPEPGGRLESEREPVTKPADVPRQAVQDTSKPKTCSDLGGFECDVGEDCAGEWLDVDDTFNCCSVECASDQDILEIDPFEATPEDESLGGLT